MSQQITVTPNNMLQVYDVLKKITEEKTYMVTRNVYKTELDKAVFLIKKYGEKWNSIRVGPMVLLSKQSVKDMKDQSIRIQRTLSEIGGMAIAVGGSTESSYTSLIYNTDTVYFTNGGIYIFKNGTCILSKLIPHFEVWRYTI
jgi:hypothetical protein